MKEEIGTFTFNTISMNVAIIVYATRVIPVPKTRPNAIASDLLFVRVHKKIIIEFTDGRVEEKDSKSLKSAKSLILKK